MLNWDVDSINRIQEENVKQAEKDHLAQEVIEELRKFNHHYNPTLAWLGRRMLVVGTKLVEMSGSEQDSNLHLN